MYKEGWIYWLVLLGCGILMSLLPGCRKEAEEGVTHEHVVTLNFPSLQPYTTRTRAEGIVNAEEGESTFHSARIWIFSSSAVNTDKALAYKYVPDALRYTDKAGTLRVEMVLSSELKDESDVYVLVNGGEETGLSGESSREELETAVFSKPYSTLADDGLLMSRIVKGITKAQLEAGTFRIPLERGVAKVGCYFTNQTSVDFRVTSVFFSGLSSQGTVFPESVMADKVTSRPTVPSIPTISASSKSLTIAVQETIIFGKGQTKITLQEGKEQAYLNALNQTATSLTPYYIHEAASNRVKCVIRYTINGEFRSREVVLDGSIIRNHFVVVYAHYSGELSLKFVVLPWDTEDEISISYNDQFKGSLVLSSQDVRVEGDKAYATVFNDENRQVTFTMEMEVPVGARWTANLSNGNEFELYSESSASGTASGIGGAGPVTFSVRPTQAFDAAVERETELYITLTRLVDGGETENGEQVINNEGNHPGTTTRIRIRQVSADQWDAAAIQP
ncbi:hypothetical protein [Phocaeicola plebeius]|uniref:hypothetical protein n=1 Tax=Phocaeicola plebeius TaxID=310297 RepID=UPI003A8DB7DC